MQYLTPDRYCNVEPAAPRSQARAEEPLGFPQPQNAC